MEVKVKIEVDEGLINAISALANAIARRPIDNAVIQAATTKPSTKAPPTVMPAAVTAVAPVTMPVTPATVPAAPIAPVTAVPTVSATYTLEQLCYATAPLMDAGKHAELVALLAEFGVPTMQSLKEEQFGAFATRLRLLGAKI